MSVKFINDVSCMDNILYEYTYDKDFIKNKNFVKKTIKGKVINIKQFSFRRNMNINLTDQLLGAFVKKGKKLSILKNFNIFLGNFFFTMFTNKEFFKNYSHYKYIFDLFKTKQYYYNFSKLLKHPVRDLQYMFDLKTYKLGKRHRRKYNKKYNYSIVYLHKRKRVKHLLKLFYLNTNVYKEKDFNKRIFNSFVSIIFDTSNNQLLERKLSVYKVASKILNKKEF